MTNQSIVFVIDDDDAVRDSLCLLLRLRGYAPRPYASGDAFLADDANAPANAIVLLDLKMPGLSGIEVQAELRARGRQWPVIVLTAHGDAASARNTLKAGAYDFVEKPVDDAVLLATMEAAASAARSRRCDARPSRPTRSVGWRGSRRASARYWPWS